MIGPSSWISKLLFSLFLFIIFYIYLDIHLYLRIQHYPIDRNVHQTNATSVPEVKYSDVTWIQCHVNPLCDVTVKSLMLDHTNHYIFAPLAVIFDDLTGISRHESITPNAISFFHVFVALVSGRLVASDSVSLRRFGVVLFQVRTFLDDLDGHVARVKRHIRGERSEIGTTGYYVDGICDAIGCVALMIGVFVFLRNNVRIFDLKTPRN